MHSDYLTDCDDDCDCDDCVDALRALIVSGDPDVRRRIALIIQITDLIGADDDDDDDEEMCFEPISARKRIVN
jgi:hypothetical protein